MNAIRLQITHDIIATIGYAPAMARPKKSEAIEARKQLVVRVTTAAYAALQASAQRSGRSVSDEVRRAIDTHVGLRPEPERPRRALAPDPKPMRRD